MEVAAIDIDSLMMKTPTIAQRKFKRSSRQRNKLISSVQIFREPAPTACKRKSPFAEEPSCLYNASSVKRSCMSPLRGSALTIKATTTTTSTCC